MSTYDERTARIRADLDHVNVSHPSHDDAWRDARRSVFHRIILDAAGVEWDDLDVREQAALAWLVGWDEPTVAGVAALLDRARSRVEVG